MFNVDTFTLNDHKKTSLTICTWMHDRVYTYLHSQKTGENRSAFKSREFMSVELEILKISLLNSSVFSVQ